MDERRKRLYDFGNHHHGGSYAVYVSPPPPPPPPAYYNGNGTGNTMAAPAGGIPFGTAGCSDMLIVVCSGTDLVTPSAHWATTFVETLTTYMGQTTSLQVFTCPNALATSFTLPSDCCWTLIQNTGSTGGASSWYFNNPGAGSFSTLTLPEVTSSTPAGTLIVACTVSVQLTGDNVVFPSPYVTLPQQQTNQTFHMRVGTAVQVGTFNSAPYGPWTATITSGSFVNPFATTILW